MTIKRATLPLLSLFSFLVVPFLVVGCTAGDEAVERGSQVGKTDHVLVGSCEDSCGEQSISGNCYCDAECTNFGDCCSDIVSECSASCDTLASDECELRADCVVGVGPGNAPDGAQGGQLTCFDAPLSCNLLASDECELRADCVVGVGPGNAPDGAQGGQLMCFDAPVALECNELDPSSCETRSDCELFVGPGNAPDGAQGGQLFCGDKQLSIEECEAQGTVVGDIGDGAVHHPDFLCPNGQPPIGIVPLGIEGAVCCGN